MPAWLRDLLARLLPRALAVRLGIRHLTPWGRYWPWQSVRVAPLDTGGTYRASNRRQDPSVDPKEPYGGESSGTGSDHGWANCTMASAATALAYQVPRGSKTAWGGDMRHHQSDMTGGTDLYDARQAWSAYGESLTIRSGAGWSGVDKAHREGRAIIAQGQGNVPGSQSFDGGHACVIAPETHSDGRWLFGDPLASDWQWVTAGSIRTWMEALSGGCYFAVGDAAPETPPGPEPEPPDTGGPADRAAGYAEGRAAGYAEGMAYGQAAEADRTFASWAPGRAVPPPPAWTARWDDATWAGTITPPPVVTEGGAWVLAAIPLTAVWMAQTPATWGAAAWTAAVWRG